MDKKNFSDLVKKYLTGEATIAEKRYLEAYYEELHTGKPIESILSEAQINALEDEMFRDIKYKLNDPPVKQLHNYKQYRNFAAVAASLLILISVGLFVRYQAKNNELYETTYAKAGNILKLKLSDGTIVWLNSKSKLTYPVSFSDKKLREIYLDGEAYFEVKKDKAHPFLVHTKNLTTRVLGTKFNVEAYNDTKSIEVTLLEGKVMLTTDGKLVAQNHKKPDTLFLKPNEKAIFKSGLFQDKLIAEQNTRVAATLDPNLMKPNKSFASNILSKHTVVNAATASSWRNGQLIFKDEPLENVLASLNRKYNVVIKANTVLSNYPITASFDNQAIDDVLLNITNQIKRKNDSGAIGTNVQYKKLGLDYYIE
jgi:transmembrane sensor